VATTPERAVAPSPSPAALLAVDGGASKTDVVVLASDGTLLGRARGGPGNHQMVGLDAAMDNLDATITAAATSAGIEVNPRTPLCRSASYCLAGLDLPIDEVRLREAIMARGWTREFALRNDTFAILRAGVDSGWGIAVVCGTGLNCVGLGADGTSVRFPSLGELSGDFTPGGAWLGVRGLGLALRARDGRGPPTVLETAIGEHFDLDSAEAVLEAVYRGDLSYARLPELAAVVLGAAAIGDGEAQRAVSVLVDEVVAMVIATVERLGLGDSTVEIVAGGGLFGDPNFERQVDDGVRNRYAAARMRRIEGPPVLGAALFGLDALDAGPAAEQALRAALA